MKKVLAVFLTIVLILTMIPVAAAEETVYSGTCGENLVIRDGSYCHIFIF